MTKAAAEPRPYHHGDLRRALVDAARRLLETEGPTALSLRAVAREAGVSPAAPYHHFRDKGELLGAVAHEGWEQMLQDMGQARAKASSPHEGMTALGVSYVRFARANPALYRVMFDHTRNKAVEPGHPPTESRAYDHVRNALIDAGADPADEIGLALASTAAWCAAHGLAEMGAFKQFEPLCQALGGEEGFLRGVFEHMRIFAEPPAR